MNVLISGGAGFIGSHLAERLLNRGEQVSIVDDLSTGSVQNIRHFKTSKNLRWFFDTVTNQQLMSELIDKADIIYHLAAAIGVDYSTNAMGSNLRGTEIILEMAAHKKKRVLITSTSEVYGRRNQAPFREDDDVALGAPPGSRWSYVCAKLIDEFLAVAYWKEKQLPTVIVRLFNVVGPRQTGFYGTVIPSLIKQALSGMDMTVFGDGSQSRCFTHVSDAVNALIALAEHSEANGEVYNIGSTEEICIVQLAQRIKEMAFSNSKIIFIPHDKAYGSGFEEMMCCRPDLTKIQKMIDYRPKMNLDVILADTIKYHVEQPAFRLVDWYHGDSRRREETGLAAAEMA